jgi:monovalent cation/hydrogen antiporter
MSTQILIVMMAAIGLTIIAERRGFQAPLFLAIIGMAVSFVPGLPRTEIEPDLILSLVLPPLLFSAAVNFSFFSFMKRLGSILNLGVLLIAVSALAVGGLFGIVFPILSIPAALILGAVVAPIDAVSATAIGKRLGLPNRLMTVLKGESLINDAAALVIFSLAVAAATGERTFISNGVLYFLFAAGLGAILGTFLGVGVHRVRQHLGNPTLVTALTVITPFGAYLLAEEMHMSGVMAVVFAGFALGTNAADMKFDGRIQEREVLNLVEALLEAFAFAYMGLQFRFVVDDALASGIDLWDLIGYSALTIALVTLVRIAWVMLSAIGSRWLHRRYMQREALMKTLGPAARPQRSRPERPLKPGRPPRRRRIPAEPLSWRENLILSWSGMRGVVTIAAAAGTPLVTSTGLDLPGRDIVITIAFAVAIGTLILQGLSLPWLIRRLGVDPSSDRQYRTDQVAIARRAMNAAAMKTVDAFRKDSTSEADIRLGEKLIANSQRDLELETDGIDRGGVDRKKLFAIIRDVQAARRSALIAERNAERLDDEIMRELLEYIDLEQAIVEQRGTRWTE